MSDVFAGSHYCAKHQGNCSQYAPENCELCKALAARPSITIEDALTVPEIRALVEYIASNWEPPGKHCNCVRCKVARPFMTPTKETKR